MMKRLKPLPASDAVVFTESSFAGHIVGGCFGRNGSIGNVDSLNTPAI